MLDHYYVRVNVALGLNDVESFPDVGYVVRRQDDGRDPLSRVAVKHVRDRRPSA